MSESLQFVFSGMAQGAIYALIALGFTLIYNASNVVNFAQGEFVMISGMTASVLAAAHVHLLVAAAAGVIAAVIIGLLLHRLAIQPARKASPLTLIVVTIGASILLRGVASVVFDKDFHRFPSFLGETPWRVGGATILPQALIVIVGAAFLMLLLWAFLSFTLTGKAMLATAANSLAAQLVGISTSRVIAISFGMSALIGAIGGVLTAPLTTTNYAMGSILALKGFAAAMLGGLGNPFGAVVGGLLLGLLEAFSAGYISSAYKDAAAFIVLLATLFVMPNGLLSNRQFERV